MHNLIPASRSYFFQSVFAGQQAAMCTTLRAENIGRNWVERVSDLVNVNAYSRVNAHE